MSAENLTYLVMSLVALVFWIFVLQGERDWARFWRRRNREIAEEQAEQRREEARRNGAGPWEL
jgi:hypothetical protein